MGKIEDSLNEFSLSLYQNYTRDRSEENVFFSPLSIYTALSMVYAGSGSKTAAQMKEVMRLSHDPANEEFYEWNIQVWFFFHWQMDSKNELFNLIKK